MRIIKEIFGRRLGLGLNGELILNRNDGLQEVFGLVATTTISNGNVLALNTTPQTVVAAPGAGLAIVPRRVLLYKAAGTAFAGIAAGADFVFKYTNASGAQCSSVIETTGFMDQATAQSRFAWGPGSTGATAGDVNPVANAAVVLHLLNSNMTTGTSALRVRVWYDLISTQF